MKRLNFNWHLYFWSASVRATSLCRLPTVSNAVLLVVKPLRGLLCLFLTCCLLIHLLLASLVTTRWWPNLWTRLTPLQTLLVLARSLQNDLFEEGKETTWFRMKSGERGWSSFISYALFFETTNFEMSDDDDTCLLRWTACSYPFYPGLASWPGEGKLAVAERYTHQLPSLYQTLVQWHQN